MKNPRSPPQQQEEEQEQEEQEQKSGLAHWAFVKANKVILFSITEVHIFFAF